MEEIKRIIPVKERCDFCKRRKAVQLCDFPVYLGKRLCFKGMTKKEIDNWTNYDTCDKNICEKCATNIDTEIDFWPSCMEKLKKVIK